MEKKRRAKGRNRDSGGPLARTLEDVLASVSMEIFPASLGSAVCTVHSRSLEHDTPLHVMVRRQDLEGAGLLIHAGADVNAVGDMGETPLHIAVQGEDNAIVQLLLRAGARRNIVSDFGERAE